MTAGLDAPRHRLFLSGRAEQAAHVLCTRAGSRLIPLAAAVRAFGQGFALRPLRAASRLCNGKSRSRHALHSNRPQNPLFCAAAAPSRTRRAFPFAPHSGVPEKSFEKAQRAAEFVHSRRTEEVRAPHGGGSPVDGFIIGQRRSVVNNAPRKFTPAFPFQYTKRHIESVIGAENTHCAGKTARRAPRRKRLRHSGSVVRREWKNYPGAFDARRSAHLPRARPSRSRPAAGIRPRGARRTDRRTSPPCAAVGCAPHITVHFLLYCPIVSFDPARMCRKCQVMRAAPPSHETRA